MSYLVTRAQAGWLQGSQQAPALPAIPCTRDSVWQKKKDCSCPALLFAKRRIFSKKPCSEVPAPLVAQNWERALPGPLGGYPDWLWVAETCPGAADNIILHKRGYMEKGARKEKGGCRLGNNSGPEHTHFPVLFVKP